MAQYALQHVDDVAFACDRKPITRGIQAHCGEHRVVVFDREETERHERDQQLLGVNRRTVRRRQRPNEERKPAGDRD